MSGARWGVVLAAALGSPALALQPLETFVRASQERNVDLEEVRAQVAQQQALADAALGRALPGLAAKGVYTRNQYNLPIGPIPPLLDFRTYLIRYNQLDAYFSVNIPLIDLASFEQVSAARTGSEAADLQLKATGLQVEAQVVQVYFQVVAGQAVVDAATRALDVARRNQELSQERFRAGKAAALEVDRANAEVERNKQAVTGAQLQISLAARALRTASGIEPDVSTPVPLQDDLHDEAPLSQFERRDEALPGLAAAVLARRSAEKRATSQKLTLLPALSASLSEHGTNTPSFIGQPWAYAAMASLSWYLDYASIASMRAQDAAAAEARAREERARLQVHDAIYRAWATVGAAIENSRSARAQQTAATHASQLAQDRYESGAATQLDLLQAQRDAFGADVARIQADADLASARLQLRFASGMDPILSKGNP